MFFARQIPTGPLADYVELLWYFEGYRPISGAQLERILPDGTMQLLISLQNEPISLGSSSQSVTPTSFGHVALCGVQSQSVIIGTSQQEAVMGVHFNAGGAFAFVGLPAGELCDVHVGLKDVWGQDAADLHDQILNLPTPAARLRRLETALLTRLLKAPARRPAVAAALSILAAPGAGEERVADLVDQSGLSARRFIQAFVGEVGLTPKLFLRIRRFQRALRAIDCLPLGTAPVWADLALGAGFYDQAHFNRDFKDFAHMTPAAYVAARGEHQNHVAVG